MQLFQLVLDHVVRDAQMHDVARSIEFAGEARRGSDIHRELVVGHSYDQYVDGLRGRGCVAPGWRRQEQKCAACYSQSDGEGCNFCHRSSLKGWFPIRRMPAVAASLGRMF